MNIHESYLKVDQYVLAYPTSTFGTSFYKLENKKSILNLIFFSDVKIFKPSKIFQLNFK